MKSPSTARGLLPVILTVVVGVAISGAAALISHRNLRQRMRHDYANISLTHAMAMQTGVDTNINEKEDFLPALYAETGDHVSAQQFEEFTAPVLRANDALGWIAWAPKMNAMSGGSGATRSSKTKGNTLSGMTRVFSDGQFVTANPQGVYFPITYVNSNAKTQPLLNSMSPAGIDIASVPQWRRELDDAVASGRSRAAPAGLEAPGLWPKSTVIVFHPIFRSGMPHSTPIERQQNLLGIVVRLVSMHTVIEDSLHFNVPVAGGAHLALLMKRPGAGMVQVYWHESRTVGKQQSGVVTAAMTKFLRWTYDFQAAGRKWTIVSLPAPEFLAREPMDTPWWILVSGLVTTMFIAGYLVIALRIRAREDAENARKLQESAQKEAENRVLNDSVVTILRSVSKLSKGDLTVQLPVNEDITGALSDAVNSMSENMGKTLNKVSLVSEQVVDASTEVQNVANRGKDAVSGTLKGMMDIRSTIQETAKRIKRLGERSQEIGSIIKLIDNISERTNVLALNANMQAASAGEAGRGFMVVAAEVQRLAESSKEATNQIAGLVGSIQGETGDAIATMDKAIAEVVRGGELAERASATMDQTEQTVAVLNQLGDELRASVNAFKLPETKELPRQAAGRAARAVA